jgi:hypothetical protein
MGSCHTRLGSGYKDLILRPNDFLLAYVQSGHIQFQNSCILDFDWQIALQSLRCVNALLRLDNRDRGEDYDVHNLTACSGAGKDFPMRLYKDAQ